MTAPIYIFTNSEQKFPTALPIQIMSYFFYEKSF